MWTIWFSILSHPMTLSHVVFIDDVLAWDSRNKEKEIVYIYIYFFLQKHILLNNYNNNNNYLRADNL